MLNHGGRLLEEARAWGIAPEQWLDLSTGINPQGWPVPTVPGRAWQRLPEAEDKLLSQARRYYNCTQLLPVAGSQAAIQALPRLRRSCHGLARVAMLAPAYKEHQHCWQREGHEVLILDAGEIEQHLDDIDVLVLINPNNPTGCSWGRTTLQHWRQRLTARGGWLLLDEAFVDVTPEHSRCSDTGAPGLIVLRSLGKFFGLAGARVGFVAAWPQLLADLDEHLGPWSLSGPSRYIAGAALADTQWQSHTRRRLQSQGRRLQAMLQTAGLSPDGGTALFQWLRTSDAGSLYQAFARRGILLRRFDEPGSLRFGLPGEEVQWQRLARALDEILAPSRRRECQA